MDLTTKQDIAESLICRWQSFCRGKNINDPKVIQMFVFIVAHQLRLQGVEYLVARRLAFVALQKWSYECEGVPASNPAVMEVLEVKVAEIL